MVYIEHGGAFNVQSVDGKQQLCYLEATTTPRFEHSTPLTLLAEQQELYPASLSAGRARLTLQVVTANTSSTADVCLVSDEAA